MLRPAIAVAVVFATACGPPPPPERPPPVFSDEPLSGVVGAAPWTFVAGATDAFLSDEEGLFSTLSNVDFTACADTAEGAQLITSLPREVGVTRLNLGGQSITFSPGAGENLVAIVGAIRIDEISDTTVTGALKASFDDDNKVDGAFSLTICPD